MPRPSDPDAHRHHAAGSSVVNSPTVNTGRQQSKPVEVVYVAIGNSDDKLGQSRWACFQIDTKDAIMAAADTIHGDWHSYPDSIYQNACFCFEIDPDKVPELKGTLAAIATEYQQDAIAWNKVTGTDFLGPSSPQASNRLGHHGSDRWTGGDKKGAR